MNPEPRETPGELEPPRGPSRRRRLFGAVLVAGGLLLGGRLWSRRPVQVTVHYELGPAAVGLRRADADFLPRDSGGGVVSASPAAHVVFRYGAAGGAPSEEVARIRLARGEYRVDVHLGYGSAPDRSAQQVIDVDGEGDVYVRLDR